MAFFELDMGTLAHGVRKVALGAHLVLAAWLGVNGIAHQAHVLWKAHAGTLRAAGDLPGLLGVGAGLLVASAAVSWSFAALARSQPSSLPALGSLALLAAILVAIALRYGTTFLGGTITLGAIDLLALGAFALARR